MSTETLKLLVILGTNRPGRVGERVGKWVIESLKAYSQFEVDFLDIADLDLDIRPSPHHPRSGIYSEGGARFAARMASADAFIIITPEYNHGYPAILKLAIDSIYAEWFAKAGSLISYGGQSAGLRSAEQLRQVLAEMRTHITRNGIAISGAQLKIDEGGTWIGADDMTAAFKSVADELYWWGSALKAARAVSPYPR